MEVRTSYGPRSSWVGGRAADAQFSGMGLAQPGDFKAGRREDQERLRGCARTGIIPGKAWRSQLGSPRGGGGGVEPKEAEERMDLAFPCLGIGLCGPATFSDTTSEWPRTPPSLPRAAAARAPAGRRGGHNVGTHPENGGRRSGSAAPRDRSAEGPGAGRRRRSAGAAAGRRPAGAPGARSARGGSWPRGIRARDRRRASGRRPRRRGSRSRRPLRLCWGEDN